MTLLVVDDDPKILDIMALWLNSPDYFLLFARNGKEALEILYDAVNTGITIDGVIVDIIMPIMDGEEFLRTKATDNRLFLIPVIIMSGFPELADKLRTIPGVRAVIKKSRDEVLDAIKQNFYCIHAEK